MPENELEGKQYLVNNEFSAADISVGYTSTIPHFWCLIFLSSSKSRCWRKGFIQTLILCSATTARICRSNMHCQRNIIPPPPIYQHSSCGARTPA